MLDGNPAACRFPAGFRWGVGNSAYQNEGDNCNSDWYLFEQGKLRKKLGDAPIRGGDRCGRAVDFYRRYEADFAEAARLGCDTFRLSLEWSRVEPSAGVYDQAALAHYRDMVRALRARGITPAVTLHHFSNPIWLARKGGWERREAIERYTAYVEQVVAWLGADVDTWITFNEPMVMAAAGYVSGDFPPGHKHQVPKALKVAANLLKAHARAYRAIHRLRSDARVGVANHHVYFAPFHNDGLLGEADRLLARMSDQLINRTFPDAISSGRIRMEALLFRIDERVKDLQGAIDFLGVNYYQRCLVNSLNPFAPNGTYTRPGTPRNDLGWEVVPEGMYHSLIAAAQYGKPIIITESGLADRSRELLPGFLVSHLQQVERAIRAGADVRGYLHWTLTDNFEWHNGYQAKFGLLAVDPEDPALARLWTPGAYVFQQIATANAIDQELVSRYSPTVA